MYTPNSTKGEIAESYSALGFSLFPVHTLEDGKCSCGNASCGSVAKHPLTANGVHDATKDVHKLRYYFGGERHVANIGLATGDVSGVWVLDVDDAEALSVLEKDHGTLPKTWTVETGGGKRHYYFRFNEECKALKNTVKMQGAIDVRATGGYVILPPSIHASGNRYRWLVSPDETKVADAPSWLINLVPKHGTQDVDRPAKAVQSVTVQRAKTLDDRIALYLERCPPAIGGENGHGTAFGICCALFKAFPELRERSDDDAALLLGAWNARCLPPWSDHELRHKIRDARKNAGVSVPSSQSEDGSEWPILSSDALHGFAGDFVRAVEPHTEADSVNLLLTSLTMFGSVVGRRASFPVGGDTHHANVYACLVGSSAKARKGTGLGCVSALFAGIDEEWTRRRFSGLSTGEGVIAAVQDSEIAKTEDGGFYVSDRRLLVTETEFAHALRVLKREGNTLSPILRDAWDRGELSILTRSNPLHATGAHVSIIGHITQEELGKFLSATDVFNGFANRFLWALCRRSKLLPEGGSLPLDELRERLRRIVQTAQRIETMKRSAEASSLWRELYPSLVAEKRGMWDAVTSRAEAQTLRLSMLYALLDVSDTIDVPHLRAALALWRYCDDSARIIFGTDSEGGTLERKILRLVSSRPGIMRTELRTSHSVKASELDSALAWLVDRGDIVCVPVYESRQSDRHYPGIGVRNVKTVDRPNHPSRTAAEDVSVPSTSLVTLDGPQGVGVSDPTADVADTRNATQNALDEAQDVPPASLGELFDWRNARSADFVEHPDGSLWVTTEDGLTPALRSALRFNQKALRPLAVYVDVDGRSDEERELLRELCRIGRE